MADPSSLYRHLPDAYSRDASSDLYKLLSGIAEGTEDAKAELSDFKDDVALARGDGQGLDWAGENFGISRPPGMLDTIYRAVCLKMAGLRRGTVAAIKSVLEAATGLSWTVQDKQLNSSIPAGEVWVSASGGFAPSYGRGAYPPIAINTTGDPIESSLAGVVLDAEGEYGGLYNDHAFGDVDIWIKAWLEKVKLAGTKIVFK